MSSSIVLLERGLQLMEERSLVMRWLVKLTWPETFPRRLAFALSIYLPVLFIVSLLIGVVKKLSLVTTMLEVWIWALVIGLVVSIAQAALAHPKSSFWKPFWAQDPPRSEL